MKGPAIEHGDDSFLIVSVFDTLVCIDHMSLQAQCLMIFHFA